MIKLDHKDILNLEKYFRISLVTKLSGIKSANLIGTLDENGIANLGIFNSVVHIGANPPYLGFIMRPLTVERQTYNNIKNKKYFTVNQVTTDMHKNAHQTSAKYPKGISEFEACNFTEHYLDDFPIPFVKESPIQIGLSFQEEHLISVNKNILIVGKIEKIILSSDFLSSDGDIDLEAIDTVGVAGLDTYYSNKRLGRYNYARVGQTVTEIKDIKST